MPTRLELLRTQLAAHRPLDATEGGHRRRMLALADAGLMGSCDPFTRSCFVPGHFTASSFVLNPQLDAVLLILHAKLSSWLQPGGHIDPEDPHVLAAARRELAEETGLCALELWRPGVTLGFLDLDIHAIPARPDEPAHEHFDLRFLFRSTTTRVSDSDEVHGARWVPVDSFDKVRSDASVDRAVTRIRQLLRASRAP